MDRPNWAPGDIDATSPSPARIYDYWLGGAHNFAVDREVGAKALETMPELRHVIRTNRSFLRRVVNHLLAAGVRQFLDLGSGIPTVGNVHEIALQTDPDARVVYVDIDPVAVAHSRTILVDHPQVNVVQKDIRDVDSVLRAPEVTGTLDFDQPIAVLMIALLHFVPDSDEPRKIVGGYRNGLPSGSYLAISQGGFEDGDESAGAREAREHYSRQVTQMSFRSSAEITAFFEGFELVEPGVTRLPLWHPESLDDVGEDAHRFNGFGAVGRKP
ncbi:hypothetical protein FKR81_31935 [Lentzea tibetensis]|uniref:S-adenosyl methyltransferase n=1 Tax=Lentzea tibetensis TaxID=2591470 RepID=A0A563EKI1_9PSEU|nr:SAM-dependent methyltransferase [Lentzea tibetensis]TWP47570.1 hypothetical protein FKR81_31935 [Lentzea tibetensis]